MSIYHFIILSFYHFIILSFYHFIILSFYHFIILSFYHFIILSRSILSFYREAFIMSSYYSDFRQKCKKNTGTKPVSFTTCRRHSRESGNPSCDIANCILITVETKFLEQKQLFLLKETDEPFFRYC